MKRVKGIRSRVLAIALLLSLSLSSAFGQGVVINEVMPSNSSILADEDGEYPDWIEFYNSGNEPIDLGGYGLSDTYAEPFRWVFPSIILNPNDFLLVWASGKDRNAPPLDNLVLIEEKSVWRYLDNGSNQGTGWLMPGFDDSQWPSGPAMLGYGDSTVYGTTLKFGPNSNNRFITYYFRKNFQIDQISWLDTIDLRLLIDDGAVVYVNGQEVVRRNMPTGTITHTTLAAVSVVDTDISNHRIPINYFVGGTNTIAVEVHQVGVTSSDIRFDLVLSTRGRMVHTNFAISSAGEELLLTDPQGIRVDAIPATRIPRDISYGRSPDGSPSFLLFSTPTPGNANSLAGYTDISPPPTFSHLGGFYTSGFNLSIASSDPDAEIIYTLDGSTPEVDNLSGKTFRYKNAYGSNSPFLTANYTTLRYTNPIAIENRTQAMEVWSRISTTHSSSESSPTSRTFKGTTITARAVKAGVLPSSPVSSTYFVSPQGRGRYSLPVISIITPPDGLFDYNRGIYTAGKIFDDWRLANPSKRADGGTPANYWQRGEAWERAAHIELIEPDSAFPAISQPIGIRIHGGWSRSHPMKSLRLYARADSGESEFSHRVFPNRPYNSYSRLILRNSGNDFGLTMFRDAAIHAVVEHLGLDVMAYRPAIVFINGEYWGLHNIRERQDRFYLASRYGVDPDNVDILTNANTAEEGDSQHYDAMIEYISLNDVSDNTHYQWVKTQMDVDNYIDYQISQIYVRNTDWPGNNIEFWRLRTPYAPNAPYGHDGRWRWMIFDTDHGFGIWNNDATRNTLQDATQAGLTNWPNPDWSTFLLRTLLRNEEFKNQFIRRFADLMNTTFQPQRAIDIVEGMRDAIQPEMQEHINRWGQPWSMDSWHGEIQKMIDFINERPTHQTTHLRQFFGLGGNLSLTVNVDSVHQGYVRVNTIPIRSTTPGVSANPYPWTGRYFRNHPVELEAVPLPGYTFSHWEGLDATGAVYKKSFTEQSVSAKAFFSPLTSLHYWHFNSMTEGTVETVRPDHSILEGASITYPGSGLGYMDRVNDGTTSNATPSVIAGFGLRVRNPSDSRELLLSLPTTGYQNIVFSYAVTRTTFGVREQVVQYRTAALGPWQELTPTVQVTEQWVVHTFNLDILEVNNNPDFAIRILFQGEQASGTTGNNRFDNIRLDGIPISTNSIDCAPCNPPRSEVGTLSISYRQGHIHLNNPYTGRATLRLFGLNGAVIGEFVLLGKGSHTLPFAPAPGIYVAKLIATDGVSSGRFYAGY